MKRILLSAGVAWLLNWNEVSYHTVPCPKPEFDLICQRRVVKPMKKTFDERENAAEFLLITKDNITDVRLEEVHQ